MTTTTTTTTTTTAAAAATTGAATTIKHQDDQETGLMNWVSRSFACAALLDSFAGSAALIRLLVCSLIPS